MAMHARALARRPRKPRVVGLAALCAAAAFATLSVGTAHADVDEVAPAPAVTSRQASTNAVIRLNDLGVAGGISEARLADAGVIEAEGSSSTEVRDSVKAVPGDKAKGYLGSYPVGPPLGDW